MSRLLTSQSAAHASTPRFGTDAAAAAVLLTEADVFIDADALLRVVRRTAQRAGGRPWMLRASWGTPHVISRGAALLQDDGDALMRCASRLAFLPACDAGLGTSAEAHGGGGGSGGGGVTLMGARLRLFEGCYANLTATCGPAAGVHTAAAFAACIEAQRVATPEQFDRCRYAHARPESPQPLLVCPPRRTLLWNQDTMFQVCARDVAVRISGVSLDRCILYAGAELEAAVGSGGVAGAMAHNGSFESLGCYAASNIRFGRARLMAARPSRSVVAGSSPGLGGGPTSLCGGDHGGFGRSRYSACGDAWVAYHHVTPATMLQLAARLGTALHAGHQLGCAEEGGCDPPLQQTSSNAGGATPISDSDRDRWRLLRRRCVG